MLARNIKYHDLDAQREKSSSIYDTLRGRSNILQHQNLLEFSLRNSTVNLLSKPKMVSTPKPLDFNLDTRFAPHRLGTPRLLTLPLECSKVETGTLLDNPRLFWEDVDAIYNTAGIRLLERAFTRKYHEGEDPGSASITLFMIADIVNTSTDTMKAVLADVQQHCLEAGITVGLEVIDSTYDRRRDCTLELSDHEAIQKWGSLSIDILRYLDTTAHKFGCSWSTIDLMRRGASADKTECPITVVIGTPQSAQDFWWDQGIEDIRALTDNKFAVEILHVASWKAMAGNRTMDDIVEESIEKDAYEDPLVMGASLGVSGTNGGGTLGGFVTVVRKGEAEARKYALTNHHVVVRSESLKEAVTAFDLTSTTPVHDRPLIVSPADDDDIMYKERLIEQMGYHLEYLNDPRNLRDRLADITSGRRFAMNTGKRTHLEETIRDNESVVQKLGLEYQEVELYNRVIGRLVAWSGRRLSPLHDSINPARNYVMDWALVEMHTTKGCGNTMQKPLAHFGVKTTLKHGQPADQYEIIDPSQEDIRVAFRGRTSGWNFGMVNPAHSLVNDESATMMSEIARIYNITESNPAYCWSIAPRTRIHKSIVCRKGDSGSVVLRDFQGVAGKWIGLMFGRRGDGCVAYVTPIQLVLSDIETTLNGTVIEPTLADGL